MLMYVSKTATNLYLENLWLWLADHDLEGPHSAQIIVYSGRGLFIDGSPGPIWLMRTGVEHNIFYQYQIANAKNLYQSLLNEVISAPGHLSPQSMFPSLCTDVRGQQDEYDRLQRKNCQ